MDTLFALVYGTIGALVFWIGSKARRWIRPKRMKVLIVKIDRRKHGKTFLSMDMEGKAICKPATICVSNEDIEDFLDKIGADDFIDYSRDAIVPNLAYYENNH